jgi:hypothetical protein
VALVTAFASSAAGSATAAGQTGATWGSNASTSSISATVYVSSIGCSKVPPGTYAGQQAGIELFGSYKSAGATVYPFDFAGYYSYCHGHTAFYSPEFLTSDPGTGMLTFKPGGFAISPGDPLALTIKTGQSGVTLTITDVNTHRTVTMSGPNLGPSTGWAAGMMPIFGGATGSPHLTGSVPLVNNHKHYKPYGGPGTIPGPVPFAPVVFQELTVDGRTVSSSDRDIHQTEWRSPNGSPAAYVPPPSKGSFVVTRVLLKRPHLGKNFDVTLAGGTVWIELPGTHKFVKLSAGMQIPNGSKIDARHGSVQITLGVLHGKSETGIFYDGEFVLHQNGKSGATTATLSGGGFGGCPKPTTKKPHSDGHSGNQLATASVAKAKKKGKKVSSLWANAHGSFTTKGSNGAAAVLGTKWYTEDTCDGTYFKVDRDKIKVTVFYPHPHYVIVTAGHSYFAPDRS